MAKQKTIEAMLKTLLEEKLAKRKIAWVRKGGGLMLALFGNPIIKISDTGIRFGLIGNTGGFHGSKDYVFLDFHHGDVASPDCDPEVTIETVLKVCDSFSDLMNGATNSKDINRMRLITAPASQAKAVIRKFVRDQLPDADISVKCYSGIHYVTIGRQAEQTNRFELIELVVDGEGNYLSRDNRSEFALLADVIKYKLGNL